MGMTVLRELPSASGPGRKQARGVSGKGVAGMGIDSRAEARLPSPPQILRARRMTEIGRGNDGSGSMRVLFVVAGGSCSARPSIPQDEREGRVSGDEWGCV